MAIGRGVGGRETTSVVNSRHLIDVHNISTDIRWYIHDTYKKNVVGIHFARGASYLCEITLSDCLVVVSSCLYIPRTCLSL